MKKPAITAKQRAFVDGYIRHGNATQAAREAGFAWPNKQADQLMAKPVIKAEIARLGKKAQEAADKATIASTDELKEMLTAMARNPKVSAKDRIAACAQLARIFGMFIDRKELALSGEFAGVVILPANGREPAPSG